MKYCNISKILKFCPALANAYHFYVGPVFKQAPAFIFIYSVVLPSVYLYVSPALIQYFR